MTVPHASGNARRPAHPGIHIHRTRADLEDFTIVRRGIRTTDVERTLLDLASTSGPSHTRRCFEAAAGRELIDLQRLAELSAGTGGRRGVRRRLVSEPSGVAADLRALLRPPATRRSRN